MSLEDGCKRALVDGGADGGEDAEEGVSTKVIWQPSQELSCGGSALLLPQLSLVQLEDPCNTIIQTVDTKGRQC